MTRINEIFSCETMQRPAVVSPDVGVMKILDVTDIPMQPKQEGEVVSIGFINYGQPLLRHHIGDVVRVAEQQKSTYRRSMPLFAIISGRAEDGVITCDGRQMVRFQVIFENLPKVVEGRVLQNTYDSILANVVSSGAPSLGEAQLIILRVKSQLGNDVNVRLNQFTSISRLENGNFLQSLLN